MSFIVQASVQCIIDEVELTLEQARTYSAFKDLVDDISKSRCKNKDETSFNYKLKICIECGFDTKRLPRSKPEKYVFILTAVKSRVEFSQYFKCVKTAGKYISKRKGK